MSKMQKTIVYLIKNAYKNSILNREIRMNQANEPSEWTKTNEPSQWTKPMNRINEQNQWTESMKQINEPNQRTLNYLSTQTICIYFYYLI